MVPFNTHIKIDDLGKKETEQKSNTIKAGLMSTSSHLPNSPLFPPSSPHLLLLTSAGNVANLRAWAMPTYSLRRARFNTSKCCNASQLTLIIKACASPVLPPPTSPHIQATRPGVWASVLTCREQHSSSHHSSSMLIVASWEEINTAIKGDITVCLGPHAHILPLSLPSLPPSVGPVYEMGLVVGGSNWKVSSMRFWSRDETPSLGEWGKWWRGTPDSSGEEVDLLVGL